MDRPTPGAPRREAGSGALTALLLAGFTAAFMQTILIPIQPALPGLVDAPASLTSWAITVTALVSAIVTPVAGRLGDMYGRRRVALILLAVMVGGSLIAGFAESAPTLIAGRALQGAGLGVTPLGIAILRDVLPKRRVPTAIAIMSATLGFGGAIGLPVSALVVANLNWHALFWTAAFLGSTSALLIFLWVPKRGTPTGGRVDVLGVFGLAIWLTGLLLLLSEGARWPAHITWVVGAISAAAFVLWALLEVRVSRPIVDLRVASQPPVLMINITSTALGFALFAANLSYPQLLARPVAMGGVGLTLLQASLVIAPIGLAMLGASWTAGYLQRWVRPKWLVASGALMLALAYVMNLVLPASVASFLAASVLVGLGIGFAYAALPSLVMAAVPIADAAAANGLNTLMRNLGTATAAAVVAAVLTAADNAIGGGMTTGYVIVFTIGLIAALVCAGLACGIPRNRLPK